MPSCGAARATDRRSSTSSTSRSTKALARLCRHAGRADLPLRFGPDMHDTCQVERLASITVRTRCSRLVRPSGRRRSGRSRRPAPAPSAPSMRTAPRPPSTAAASFSQVARCSATERGSCLASRVSKVACCARCNASTGVGGLPRPRWNWMASSPRRMLMCVRRVTQPASVQSGVNTDDLPDRPLRRICAGPFGEPHTQAVT